MAGSTLPLDTIDQWGEIKHDIVRRYAQEYARILAAQPGLHPIYIDAFSGPGEALSKKSGKLVPGSPQIVLDLEPKFGEYHFIDIDGGKAERLRSLTRGRRDVHVHEGNSNEILLTKIFPSLTYEAFRRGLCLLDPKGLHYKWEVIEHAGKLKTVDLMLNFPLMDMNRNVLWRRPEKTSEKERTRMREFWGDDSWSGAAYRERPGLFGISQEKQPNEDVVNAYCDRLRTIFRYVARPIPMKNSKRAIVYYLLFASHKPVAKKIAEYVFDRYRAGGFR